ncbi:MAG: tetratricopeptide repeat protein, partial [Deltaproteobacteria bacterium]
YRDALRAYAQAVKLDFELPVTWYNIACSHARLAEKEKALDALEKAIEAGFDAFDYAAQDPDLAPLRGDERFEALISKGEEAAAKARLEEAEHLFAERRWDEAARAYREALAKDPSPAEAWFNYGICLHQQQDYKAAIDAYRKAMARGVNAAICAYDIACAHALLGEKDQAFEWLEKIDPAEFESFADYLETDSDLATLRDDPRFQALLERIEGKPQEEGARKDAEGARKDAETAFASGAWEEAARAYAIVTGENPDDGEAWFRLGYARHLLEDFDGAIEAFAHAAALEYSPATSYYNIACGHARKNEKEKALDALEKAITAGFGDVEMLRNDPDLEAIRGEERFERLVERLKK